MSAHQLLPIPELFARAWERVVKHFGQLSLLSLYALGAFFFCTMLFMGIWSFTGFIQALTWFWYLPMSSSVPMLTLVAVSIAAVYIILSIFRSSALYILSESHHSVPLPKTVWRSMQMVIPLFIANVTILFVVLGGSFLLLFPGLIMAFYLMFVQLIVLFEGKRVSQAIKTSAGYVSQFAGALFIRLCVFIFMYILLMVLVVPIIKTIFTWNVLSTIFTMAISFILQFYTLAFAVTLYQDLRTKAHPDHTLKSHWIWFLASIGWIVGGLFLLAVVNLR